LQRVDGLRTELTDVTEVEYRQLRLERVVLARCLDDRQEEDAVTSMSELRALAETAGSEVPMPCSSDGAPGPRHVHRTRQVEEVREIVIATGADTVICDGD